MITLMLSFLTGIIGPLLPSVLAFFKEKDDRAHELAMLEARLKASASEHAWRMEEINATADIEEAKVLHTPTSSFGVQLLDAADKWADNPWGKWLITPGFFLYVVLDFVNGMVRPVIAYSAFFFYVAYKWSIFASANLQLNTPEAINATWTDNDWAVLLMVLGFFFGQRAAKAVLGGSAFTSKPNG